MKSEASEHQKVTVDHLRRNAYLYIRQSTLHQVSENTESTQRQYALRQRAVALGWPSERVIVIDSDLGQSGASAKDREGFQRLVAEVGMGNAGIVMGLEVSRLARNSADWHRLLEICALTETLILDEDGLYDPKQFNDRLLLGLKGTMSEAELHLIKSRMRGGILNKARRGELGIHLPVGLVYNEDSQVILDPDQEVQESLRVFFKTYHRTGSACATVKAFRKQGLLFPRRLRQRPRQGELIWDELQHSRAIEVLHNPRYAGAFVYGRTHTRKKVDGRVFLEGLPQEQWHTLLLDAHPGYISWEEYQDNQRRLKQSRTFGQERHNGPPREGQALLQGLVICGVCGRKMGVTYHQRVNQLASVYVCHGDERVLGRTYCQWISGTAIDETIGTLAVEAVTPMALEVALAVQQELQSRLEEADQLRRKQVERARYEADLARRRYMQVDPDNRLVADSLEAEWNGKLRTLNAVQEEYERRLKADRIPLDDQQQKQILALATDFPRLWCDPKTPQRERKRMLRLLLEDVTLIKDKQVTVHVRFKGGAVKTLTLPRPLPPAKMWTTAEDVVAEIDRLLEDHTYGYIASRLNERGLRSGKGSVFNARIIGHIQKAYELKSRYDRLRAQGMLTSKEIADRLGVASTTIPIWYKNGLVVGHPYNDRNNYLYEPPGDHPPTKTLGKKLSGRRHTDQTPQSTYERGAV